MLARLSQQVGYSFVASLTSVAQYRICTITSSYALMHTPGPRFCVLPCVLLNMLDICVLLYVLIVVCAAPYAQYLCAALCANCWMLLLDMLNICMLLCVLIVVCAARCTQYLCVALCAYYCMCHSICWIFFLLLYFSVLPR